MYLSKNEQYEHIGYCTHFKDFTIAPFVMDKVKAQIEEQPISIVTLDKEAILELRARLETVLTQKLDKYEKPVIAEQAKRFVSTKAVEYKDKHYELMERGNLEHYEIANLISSVETAERAILENCQYEIFFKKGFTYRDDKILRFVRYVGKCATTISEINKRYEMVLTIDEIMQTLKKLAQVDCLVIRDDQVMVTRIGEHIL
jgi:hypothetical protein